MKVTVQSIKFDADKKLVDFVEGKVIKLAGLYEGVIGGEVYLRLDNSATMDNKIAEIKLNIPGNDLFAKKQCKSFEEATDTAIAALRRQLRKHKERQKSGK
ncbi:MAG: HPF/RaiA family ribosome-associated protein [Bacteroidetes bacterium]|nr:HPF/RaiA family ribosome-associated protein [Bacteroidota bacterium]MBU1719460.1 HPF/RaiA family ribosome-associated protein [Bacteroidota bacterium]